MNKPAVLVITDTLPEDVLCARLGVGIHSIKQARKFGVFPASWYAPMLDLCGEAGITCPLDAFNWKAPDASPEAAE